MIIYLFIFTFLIQQEEVATQLLQPAMVKKVKVTHNHTCSMYRKISPNWLLYIKSQVKTFFDIFLSCQKQTERMFEIIQGIPIAFVNFIWFSDITHDLQSNVSSSLIHSSTKRGAIKFHCLCKEECHLNGSNFQLCHFSPWPTFESCEFYVHIIVNDSSLWL